MAGKDVFEIHFHAGAGQPVESAEGIRAEVAADKRLLS